ncbi:MAG: hypothetical protein J4F97_03675 [Pseudomonadales bacterium]|nr:hypothetical protein [Pseudomonadales bacterium]
MGDTTLALSLPGAREGYLNWDSDEDGESILRREIPPAGTVPMKWSSKRTAPKRRSLTFRSMLLQDPRS